MEQKALTLAGVTGAISTFTKPTESVAIQYEKSKQADYFNTVVLIVVAILAIAFTAGLVYLVK